MSQMRAAVSSALGEIASTRDSAGSPIRVTCTACFPAESLVFAGHFPGHPVLPGVVELLLAECALNAAGAVSDTVKDAKFLRPVGPGEHLDLVCERKGTGWICTLSSGDECAAKIRFA